ncbi:hypothetical protein OKA06_17555 [Novosphingobium sp. MW5]|nr:hypothetical protein [Novosphingobium sp. MW5]
MPEDRGRAARLERLWLRAWKIAEDNGHGHRLPILHHLAMRGHELGLLDLANFQIIDGDRNTAGRLADGHSPVRLMYRAYKRGSPTAAQNMALTYFWLNDLCGYRHWLRKAARAGDQDAGLELKRFETRQPFTLAKRMRRLRPLRRDER